MLVLSLLKLKPYHVLFRETPAKKKTKPFKPSGLRRSVDIHNGDLRGDCAGVVHTPAPTPTPARKASAHVKIEREGTVVSMAKGFVSDGEDDGVEERAALTNSAPRVRGTGQVSLKC